MKYFGFTLLLSLVLTSQVLSQDSVPETMNRHSIGSSVFMLGNFLEDSPDYVLLTYGYRLSEQDRIYTEFNTWRYSEPLGTYGSGEGFYPGYVRAFGIGFGYQRFFWKGAYAAVSATPFIQKYNDEDNNTSQSGFQLYTQLISGYRFQFLKDRLYIEPALALKYWPIETNTPASFVEIDEGTPIYIFEPSFNIGIRF